MVDPHTVTQSIVTALKQSGNLPDSTSYSTYELDTDGGQSNVRPPVVEVSIVDQIRSEPHNTNFNGFVEDDAGNYIGYYYKALFEMTLQIDVWTAEGGGFNPYEVGTSVRRSLYRYDERQYYDDLPDPDEPTKDLGDIDRVLVGDGSVENDLTMTPSLRRWRQTVDVWFHETVNTAEEYGAEDYIVDVVGPQDGDMEAGQDVAIVFDATPNTTSETDTYT